MTDEDVVLKEGKRERGAVKGCQQMARVEEKIEGINGGGGGGGGCVGKVHLSVIAAERRLSI